eukprot:93987_1
MTTFSVFLFAILSLSNSATVNYQFSVDPSKVLRNIQYPFYGFTFDYWKNKDSGGKWYPNASILVLDLENPDLVALTKEISPAILRIGGSPQDSVVYNISGECSQKYGLPGYGCSQTTNSEYYGCINKTRWDQINAFAQATGIQLLYGLNACYGRKSSSSPMNLSNARNLVEYTNSLGSKAGVFGFELGNEIDGHIDVNVYSSDFYNLYKIMNGKYKMVGTDNGLGSYITQFIQNLQKDGKVDEILYRLTYHHYPNCAYPGSNTVFDLSCLGSSGNDAASCYKQASPYNISCVMGEGSEHSGGGTPDVSNTFVDNFYYLNQLGSVLTNGDVGTIRSDLMGGDYELIDHMTVRPNPDYWILYIWKQLIGNALYSSSVSPNQNVRGFAFRSKKSSNNIVLALINFDLKNSANINIVVNGTSTTYQSDEYYLKPNGTELNSRMINVNDVLMEYKPPGTFPTLKSVKGNGKSIQLSPARIAFVELSPQ